MISDLTFSDHADLRCAQRNLTPAEVAYVVRHGRRSRRAGAIFVNLGRRDVPAADRRNQRVAQLIGTTAVVASDGGLIITVYRNEAAHKSNRRKAKYRRERAG